MPVIQHSSTFILDNGAASLKCGFSNAAAPRAIPNCISKAKSEKRRAFVGDQIDDCRDLSSLYYMLPFQKGYLVNWDHQKTVWDYVFGKNCLNFDPAAKDLVFTVPYFNFASIQEGLSELLFEEYGFNGVFCTHPADLACYKNKTDFPEESCCLVVDSGFSFTHVSSVNSIPRYLAFLQTLCSSPRWCRLSAAGGSGRRSRGSTWAGSC
jgi:actin-related protein 6